MGEPVINWLYEAIDQFDDTRRREGSAVFHRRVAEAVRAHPQLLAQHESLTASKEAIGEARSGYLPTITGSSDGGYRRVAPTVEGSRGYARNGLGVGVQVRQTLYDFGATSSLVEAAEQRLSSSEARRDSTELDLMMRAIAAHLDVMRGRMLVGLAERNAADRLSIVQLLESRRILGGGTDPDVRRATARLASGRSALVAFENRLRIAEAAYQELYGTMPERLTLPESPSTVASLEPALKLALERHPAMREAKADAGAARSEADAVSARTLPTVGLEGGVSRREKIGDGLPGTDASLLLVFRYNFYTGGADTARRNQAAARGRQAEFDERSVARQLDRAVRQVHAEVESATRAVEARMLAVFANADALRASREQLEINRGSILDLLKAQEDLFDAGRELIDTVFDGAIARYRLLQLTGSLAETIGTIASSARAR